MKTNTIIPAKNLAPKPVLFNRESFLADLTWECAEKLRRGQKVDLRHYLAKCPDDEARREFRVVIGMSVLADAAFAKTN